MMSLNPFSLCLLVLEGLTIGGRLHAAPFEISNYRFKLKKTLDLFNDVNSTRHSTFCSRITGAWIDRDLQEIESRLKEVEKSLSRTMRNTSSNRNVAWTDTVAWHFIHSHIADTNNDILLFCEEKLLRIEAALKEENQERPLRLQRFYFEDLEIQTSLALSKRVEKNRKLYSGFGVQISRPQGL